MRGVAALAVMFSVVLGTTVLAASGLCESCGDVVAAPEVSPASISTALTLLAGSVLVLRARRGRR